MWSTLCCRRCSGIRPDVISRPSRWATTRYRFSVSFLLNTKFTSNFYVSEVFLVWWMNFFLVIEVFVLSTVDWLLGCLNFLCIVRLIDWSIGFLCITPLIDWLIDGLTENILLKRHFKIEVFHFPYLERPTGTHSTPSKADTFAARRSRVCPCSPGVHDRQLCSRWRSRRKSRRMSRNTRRISRLGIKCCSIRRRRYIFLFSRKTFFHVGILPSLVCLVYRKWLRSAKRRWMLSRRTWPRSSMPSRLLVTRESHSVEVKIWGVFSRPSSNIFLYFFKFWSSNLNGFFWPKTLRIFYAVFFVFCFSSLNVTEVHSISSLNTFWDFMEYVYVLWNEFQFNLFGFVLWNIFLFLWKEFKN